MRIRKIVLILLFVSVPIVMPPPVYGQLGIIEIIRQGVKRAIKAVDLKIQRLQNQSIWLQNAQQVLENTLSKLKLSQIAEWTDKQREQYQKYYQELSQVRSWISQYSRLKEMTERQISLVKEYQRVWTIIRSAEVYSTEELEFMARVYNGMLDESFRSVEQLSQVVRSFSLDMSDAARLTLINQAADRLQVNYNDLRRFNTENLLLGLQREHQQREIDRQWRWIGKEAYR